MKHLARILPLLLWTGAAAAQDAVKFSNEWIKEPQGSTTELPTPQKFRIGMRADSQPVPIVYSWSERSFNAQTVKGHPISSNAISAYDVLPDVGHPLHKFKEANIVDRDVNGNETTLYDCINSPTVCAALDPKVSPDNTKIAFWVVFAEQIVNEAPTIHGRYEIPVIHTPIKAQIHVYDTITKKTTTWDTPDGRFDIHPEWISNDKLIFVSNRAGHPTVYINWAPKNAIGTSPYSQVIQRYTASVDGTGIVGIGPHDDQAYHPYVLSNGDIITSLWRADDEHGRNQGNGRITLPNEWWMTETDQFGGNETTLLNAHGLSYKGNEPRSQSLLAVHFYGERANGDICSANYYRRTHLGQGQVLCFPRLPRGVEGIGDTLFPDIYTVTPWGQEEDNPTNRDSQGRLLGNAGYPVGLPNGDLMLTWGRGWCYNLLHPEKANDEFLGGQPGCDVGIYRTTVIPSRNPYEDLVAIVDEPTRHEFAPDIRLPYSEIYGKPMPIQQVRKVQKKPDGTEFCSLEVINVFLSELYRPSDLSDRFTKSGAPIEEGYTIGDLAKVAVYEALPNTIPEKKVPEEEEPREGQVLKLLGYATPESDGSMNFEIPCDTPYKLYGVDQHGVEFIRDQSKHSNRPGEARTCVGCHGGHTEKNAVPDVEAAFGKTIAAKKGPQPLQPGQY